MEEGKASKTISTQGGILYGILDRTGNHLYVIIISEEKDVFIYKYKSDAEGLRKPGRNQEKEILEQISKKLGKGSITVSYETKEGNQSFAFEKCSDSEVGNQIAVFLCVSPERRPQTIPSSFILSLDMDRFRKVINMLDSESIECIRIISLSSKVKNCLKLEEKIKKDVITHASRNKKIDLRPVLESNSVLWDILFSESEIIDNCMLGIFTLYGLYWTLCGSKGKEKSLMESVKNITLLDSNTQITEDIVKRLLYGLYGKILTFINNNLDKILDHIFRGTQTVSLSDYENKFKDEKTSSEDGNMGVDLGEIYLRSVNEIIDYIEKLQADNRSILKPYALAYIIYYVDVLYTATSIATIFENVCGRQENQVSQQIDKIYRKAINLHQEFKNENKESLSGIISKIINNIPQIRPEDLKESLEHLKKIIGWGGKRSSSTYFSYFAQAIYLETQSDSNKMEELFSYTREFLKKEPLHVGMFDSFRDHLCRKNFFKKNKGLCEQSLDEWFKELDEEFQDKFKGDARKNANKFLTKPAQKLEKEFRDKLRNLSEKIKGQNQ